MFFVNINGDFKAIIEIVISCDDAFLFAHINRTRINDPARNLNLPLLNAYSIN